MENIIETIIKKEEYFWKAYKKAESSCEEGSNRMAEKFKNQHEAIMNLIEELGIERWYNHV